MLKNIGMKELIVQDYLMIGQDMIKNNIIIPKDYMLDKDGLQNII